ncbi:tryptophan--tRNA ligase [Candidatus Nomurabacteria bacterium RIFCSPLOWO2_01_FULL_36_10b]|uniref:Tryptophan--tRNA ligase n=1 Tax=Candidatus Nomurabacteria bacterium RIFCSPLOWO2_01_FULL_36_10b TaxID=1801766 RepID=A0A1F6WPE7_9BACT|nr:MAG: tryptophan--tRNA ligase [Candidatus Nomurabacteria bacterium RIFCSPLOWO2_01_FULL_36_10b]
MNDNSSHFKPIILTGDRPTGALHLGHYVGSIQNRLKFQDEYDTCFYMVADVQALTDNADDPQKVRDNVIEVVLDNLAVGVDPTKTHFFIQSMVPEIAELTVFFMNLVTVQQLSHNPTIKTEALQKGYFLQNKFLTADGGEEKNIGHGIPLGFLAYPVSQAADILICKANIVPVGEDQMPVLEQANDIVKKFNATYGREVFPMIKGIVGSTPRLVGTDGSSKASKTLGNTIMLSDSPEEIERKVMSMYTDPNRLKKTDEGQIEGNVVFTYLDIFGTDKKKIEDFKRRYIAGGDDAPGDIEIKKYLIEELRKLLDPIRARREEYAKDIPAIEKILREGNAVARKYAQATMQEVREVMKINYKF